MTKINELQEELVDEIISLLDRGQKDISIKAPTGSGKTHMMAMLMDKLLRENEKLVFLVSSLSKGDLAEQCFKSFKKNSEYNFTRLKPYLISTGNENTKNTEYSIWIDYRHNVYVLPTNQFTTSSRIGKESTLRCFIEACKRSEREIILIRDESHIATNNLNALNEYFSKTIHFSATPKDNKFDLMLSESEAVRAKLIKEIEFIDNANDELEKGLRKALKHFKNEIKPVYKKAGEKVGIDIVPAFIVQISNTEKGEEQYEAIKKVVEEQGLMWVRFASNEKDYETNNAIIKEKNKKMWREYIKEANYPVDVIIFKMVITEGFDIPRACVLYQVRDTQSKVLDEQVMGRVRRNPCLLDFHKLDEKTKEVFSTAYIYGVKPKENKGRKKLWLKEGEILKEQKIIQEFKVPFKTFRLKKVPMKDIDISECMKDTLTHKSIFKAYRELNKCDEVIKDKLKDCLSSFKQWFLFVNNLDDIKEKCKAVVESYEEKYGFIEEMKKGFRAENYTFMEKTDNGFDCDYCIWTSDDKNDEFFHDSKAELEWFRILNRLRDDCCKTVEIDKKTIYLFGKNYPDNSNVKFDYYHNTIHTSYPDFIFKDKKDRIHIFEVKSVNGKGNSINFNEEQYTKKITQLQQAYRFASEKIEEYVFYIPIQKDDSWEIYRYEKGKEYKFNNKTEFEEYLKNNCV